MNDKAQLVRVLGELPRPLQRCTFLDVLENLLIARLITNDHQAAARLLHRLQRFVIGGHARRAGPGQLQRL